MVTKNNLIISEQMLDSNLSIKIMELRIIYYEQF